MIRQLVSILMLVLSIGQGGITHFADQTNLGGNLYLVNRTFRLTEQYQPSDLVTPAVRRAGSGIRMRSEAAGMLEAMFEAASKEGYRLVAISGYRSYQTQRTIYQRKIRSTGSVEKAQLLVAPPGTSEHQLGLAMDIGRQTSAKLNASFGKSKEGRWVSENAARFGFILRYKAEWTPVTGYADEPWHLRYVGREHAEAVSQLNIPLETYIEALSNAAYGEMLADAK